MKVLLIRPPSRYFGSSAKPSASLPLGLLSIAAVLEKNGIDVALYDAQVNSDEPIARTPDGCAYVGDRWEKISEEIARIKPDIVGISNMFTVQAQSAITAAEKIKQVDKNILIVVGGSHPTVRPEDFFLKTSAIDIVCMGEGEYAMLDIVESFKSQKGFEGIPGIAVRDGGGCKVNAPRPAIQDLDALPFPAYHLIDLEDYFSLNAQGFEDRPVWHYPGVERAVSVVTSRGCPFQCVFCSIHLHMGRAWRPHSVSYVVDHLRFLVNQYRVNHIHFEDDNLTLDPARFHGILDAWPKNHFSLTWDTPNGVRVDTLSEETLERCQKTGCAYLVFGVESGNERVLNEVICKRLDLNKVSEAASRCRRLGLDAMAFYVVGFPSETKEEMQDTINFALGLQKRYDVTPSLFVATPLPGTRLLEVFRKEENLKTELTPEQLARMTLGGFLMGTREVAAQDMARLIKDFTGRFKKIFVLRAMFFLITNPGVLWRLVFFCARRKGRCGKALLYDMLQFKGCLKRKVGYVQG